MKKFTLFFLSLFFVFGAAIAQNAEKKWAIGLGPGIHYNLNKGEIGGFSHEFYLSRYLTPSFDLRLNSTGGYEDGGIDYQSAYLNLRYKFYNGYIFSETAAIQPYIYGGGGMLWDNQESGFAANAGLGFKFPIGENTSLFIEGGWTNGIEGVRGSTIAPHPEVTVVDDMMKLTGIIEFSFGAAKDSDGDGVKDKKDKCPGTPAGVAVDEDGCPLDRDGDGVPDYKDDCPDEAGDARFNGCPDKDGDGIPDKDDDCPDIPGLAKFNGCPDTDGDGVPDKDDKCPDTPKGCPVDANGCPLDSDGDGVIDCEDDCPTEAGPASNKGCPDWEELNLSTIYFDFDKAELKPEGRAELDKLASDLNASKEYEIVVGGHTCSIGTDAYNMKLSEKRAQEVVKYLLTKGVNNAYVGSNNYGESKPALPNNSIENREKNRRVEFEVAKIRK
ncbi:MAG: OmpA family protein [Prolixibacteraceae bacterium]|nr:OmpA family protein [Prolixibacteraceae bacterium]